MRDPTLAYIIYQDTMENLTKAVTRAWEEYLQHGHPTRGEQTPYEMFLEAVEAPMLAATLVHTRGNQTKAANLLIMNRNTLRSRIRAYGLAPNAAPRREHPNLDELLQAKEDLDWLVFHGASVRHTRDGEDCWVVDSEGKPYGDVKHSTVRQAVEFARVLQDRRDPEGDY